MDGIDWIDILSKIGIAIAIVVVTWILAKVVKWAIGKLVARLRFLQRPGADGRSLGESLGRVGSLLVWLFGLVAILQVFALDAVLSPIQGALNAVMEYLPNVLGAVFVFFIGYIIAKIAKQLVEAAVGMINFSGIASKVKNVNPTGEPAGATASTGGQVPQPAAADPGAPAPGAAYAAPDANQQPYSPQPADQGSGMSSQRIGSIAGNLVFAVIVILVAIAALQILGISAISTPAEQMLTLILNAIPAIIAAVLILGIGYLIAKFIGSILESTLTGLGTDRAVASLGVMGPEKSASTIITRIAQVAIMVFFAIMAARALNFPEVTAILNEVLELGGRVLFGGVIIAAGFLVAKIVSRAIGSGTTSTVVRYATIALFVAMGLKYMGIADSIITLAFGAVVVGGALAAALAFGLGGREAAARTLTELRAKKDTPA
ncbi:MAG TPA: mechanosensitive ion channel [Candidatus Ruania gallistercoris]|uniref:Mechanosensitive ion channel n=1 Tax=Candidatus Ruania gallistercoris TaxID=2838746 RepID=A0A9D2ECQ7_9MICO|nr:mechanosensitive ion channel [Candidatus Ruania gallistercoris]